MSSPFPLKPTHKPVKAYFDALATFAKHGHTTEGNTRSAFADLLKRCCPPYGWHLVEEHAFKGTGKQPLRADGAIITDFNLLHGLWEAKDSDDDLRKEIKSKVAKGYPLTNILFQSPTRAVLYQDNRIAFDDSITAPEKLVEVLESFFDHRQPHEVDLEDAIAKFAEKIPELAQGVAARTSSPSPNSAGSPSTPTSPTMPSARCSSSTSSPSASSARSSTTRSSCSATSSPSRSKRSSAPSGLPDLLYQ